MISDAETPVTVEHIKGEAEGPLRRCAVTRVEAPKAELLRFVASPDGTIVPDLSARLPGRGVWLTCSAAIVEEAVRKKVFARALKRSVRTAPDLARTVETLLEKRALAALSLANKAGLVVAGYSRVDEAVSTGNAHILIHASDGSADGIRRLDRKHRAIVTELGLQYLTTTAFTCEQLSLAIGRANVVHAALEQGGATEQFQQHTLRLLRFRGSESQEEPKLAGSDVDPEASDLQTGKL